MGRNYFTDRINYLPTSDPNKRIEYAIQDNYTSNELISVLFELNHEWLVGIFEYVYILQADEFEEDSLGIYLCAVHQTNSHKSFCELVDYSCERIASDPRSTRLDALVPKVCPTLEYAQALMNLDAVGRV